MKSKQNFPFTTVGGFVLLKLFTLLFAIISIILVTVSLLKAKAEVRGDAKGMDKETLLLLQFLMGPNQSLVGCCRMTLSLMGFESFLIP